MKKLLTIVTISTLAHLHISTLILAQHTFQRTYGGTFVDIGFDAIQTSDGGFVLTGYTQNFGPSFTDNIFLLKVDCQGTLLWTRSFGGAEPDKARSVAQTSDGGFVMTGYTTSYGTGGDGDLFLLKTNSTGIFQWFKTFGTSTNFEDGWCVRQTSDGGYIIVGGARPQAGLDRGLYLIKTDINGTMEWAKIFGGSSMEQGYSVVESDDGGFVAVGQSSSFGAGTSGVYVVKTDINGNILWTKIYGTSSSGRAIGKTNDGGYIIGGSLGGDFYMLKIDKDGNFQWSKSYETDGDTRSEICYDIQQTAEGGYIIVGDNSNVILDINGMDACLIKTNSAGDVEWAKVYGGINVDHGFGVQQAKDWGYIIGGYSLGLGNNSTETYLVKTDAYGNSGCNDSAIIVKDSFILTQINFGGTSSDHGIALSAIPGMSNAPPAITLLCEDSTISADFTINDTSICEGDCINFINLTSYNMDFEWLFPGGTPASSTDRDPIICYNDPGIFDVIMIYTDSCNGFTTDTIVKNNYISVLKCDPSVGNQLIFIPNSFTPNGDGQNDRFFVKGMNIKAIYINIYNRWGEKVFETTDLSVGWDGTYKGKKLNTDVFAWYAEVEFEDGDRIYRKGNVTLIR